MVAAGFKLASTTRREHCRQDTREASRLFCAAVQQVLSCLATTHSAQLSCRTSMMHSASLQSGPTSAFSRLQPTVRTSPPPTTMTTSPSKESSGNSTFTVESLIAKDTDADRSRRENKRAFTVEGILERDSGNAVKEFMVPSQISIPAPADVSVSWASCPTNFTWLTNNSRISPTSK